MLGRHRRDEAPAIDMVAVVAQLKTSIKACARAMDLADQQEVAAWRLLANQRGRLVEVGELQLRLLRTDLASMRGEVAP